MKNDVFSKILRNEIPANRVYETDTTLVFLDINPEANIHALAITKKFYESYDDFLTNSNHNEFLTFWKDVQHAAKIALNLNDGYRIVTNSGKGGKQEVQYFHVHIMSFYE